MGTLPTEKKQHFSRCISTVVHAYKSTKIDATGYFRYRLMFGREALLPVDLAFGISLDVMAAATHRGNMERLCKSLKTAYEKHEKPLMQRQRNKRTYDLQVWVHDLQPGDKVSPKNLGPAGKHKVSKKWRSQQYVVCKQLIGFPFYQIHSDTRTKTSENLELESLTVSV